MVKRQSVCPNLTPAGDVGRGDRRFSPGEESNRILQEELRTANITPTPKRAVWPIYTKRRSSAMTVQEEPFCKAVMFDVATESGTVGLSKGNATNTSEGVPESFLISGGFSTLEGIAQRQADGRFAGNRMGYDGEGMVRIPPVDEMFGQESPPKERAKY